MAAAAVAIVNALSGSTVIVSLGRRSVSVQQRDVDALVRSLRLLESHEGDTVAEEISALALAGVRADLRLLPGELQALIDALLALETPSRRLEPRLARILALARAEATV